MGKAKTEAAPTGTPPKTGTQMQNADANKQAFDTLRQLFERSKNQIQLVLPNKMDSDRMIRIALTVCQRQPKLLQCHPMSVVACTMMASELGLELSGPLGQACMVPRKNKHAGGRLEATFQVGYRGFYHLAYNTGKVATFQPRVVHLNDEFHITYGTNPEIQHRPKLTGDPGPAIGYYIVVDLLPSGRDFEFMTHTQMVAHRKRFAADNKIWDSDFEPMALKTVVRRICKRLPLSATLVKAAMFDEFEEAGIQTYQGNDMAGATAAKLTALKDKLAEVGFDTTMPDDIHTETNDQRGETDAPKTETNAPKTETDAPKTETNATAADPDAKVAEATKVEIAKLFERSRWTPEVRQSFLKNWSTGDLDDFTEAQAGEVIQKLLRAIGGAK